MTQKQQITLITWRFYLILGVIGLAVLGLIWRVFDLAILDQHFLRQQGDERVLRMVSTPAFRGMIVDRNGYPLAVSTTVYSAWMNPKEFKLEKSSLNALSHLLELKPKAISTLYQQKKAKEFVYLKRSLSPELAKQIKALNIPGIYLQQDYRRYYPEGEVASQVIGFTNIDDHGQEGMELAYDQWLQGEPGKKWVIKDRIGRVISDVQRVQEEEPGHDLVLSIDRRIQYLAYRELLAGIIRNQAASGSAIVLDVESGEVLAMVNYPSFNPNNRTAQRKDGFRNRAITDTMEPGSTIKAFTVASALESGVFKPDSVIDTAPGWMRVGHHIVKDEKNNHFLSISEILQISSNMGAAKMVLSMPSNQLWDVLQRVGFGESTQVNFPGEQTGSLTKRDPWPPFDLATLSFGYGLSATPLQIARAYSVLANMGVKKPVSLLRVEKAPAGEAVLKPKIAQDMLSLLETVVTAKDGTGRLASVPGYRVAGKTGTSKMLGDKGYEQHRYITSFAGIAPVTHPRLVVVVVIQDPLGKNYLAAQVSAPVFERIMEGSLRILDVAPDALPPADAIGA